MWCVTGCDVMRCDVRFMWCEVLYCRLMWSDVRSSDLMWSDAMVWDVMWLVVRSDDVMRCGCVMCWIGRWRAVICGDPWRDVDSNAQWNPGMQNAKRLGRELMSQHYNSVLRQRTTEYYSRVQCSYCIHATTTFMFGIDNTWKFQCIARSHLWDAKPNGTTTFETSST